MSKKVSKQELEEKENRRKAFRIAGIKAVQAIANWQELTGQEIKDIVDAEMVAQGYGEFLTPEVVRKHSKALEAKPRYSEQQLKDIRLLNELRIKYPGL